MILTGVTVVASIAAVAVLVLLFVRPTWAIIVLAATFPFNLWAPRLPVPGLNTETIMIGLAVALMLVRFRRLPPLTLSGPPIAYVAVIFMGLVIALPWARSMTTAGGADSAVWVIFKIAKSITFMTLVFFPIYWFFDSADLRRQLLEAISISLLLNALLTILDGLIKFNPEGAGSGRAFGVFLDPNGCCQYLGSMSLVSYYLFTRTDIPKIRRWLHLGIYGLGWIALVMTLSRGGWIGTIAGHFVFFLFLNRGAAVAGVVALVLLGTIAYGVLPENVRGRIESTRGTGVVRYNVAGGEYLDSSSATRLVYYNILVDMFVERPIWGHGLYAFSLRTPEWGAKYGLLRRRDPHSLFIRMASEEGIIGIAVFAWMWLVLLMMGRELWREGGKEERTLGAVAWGVVGVLGVANLTSSSFLYTKPIAFYFWVVYAIVSRAYIDRWNDVGEESEEGAPVLEASYSRHYGWARSALDEGR